MSGALAELLVKMTAESAQLRRDLAAVRKEMNETHSAFAKLKEMGKEAVEVLGLYEAAKGFAELAYKTIEAAEGLNKLSMKTGMATEELSKLQFAAKIADVSSEGLEKGLRKLSVSAAEAAGGGKAQAAVWDAIGVSVKDAEGNVRPMGDLLAAVADRFQGYEDGAAKANIAVKLFGKSGTDMIPLLNEGSAGLKKMGDEAEKFGLVVGGKMARQAEEFNDNLNRIGTSAEGFARGLLAELLPTLTMLSDEWVAQKKQASDMEGEISALAATFKGLATALMIVAGSFAQVGRLAGAAGATMSEAASWWLVPNSKKLKSNVRSIWESWEQDATKSAEEYVRLMNAIWGKAGDQVEITFKELEKKAAPSVSGEAKGPKGETGLGRLQKALASLTVKGLDDAKSPTRMEDAFSAKLSSGGELFKSWQQAGRAGDALVEAILAAARAMDQDRVATEKAAEVQKKLDDERNRATSIVESVRTADEKHAVTLRELGILYAHGALDALSYTRAAKEADRILRESSPTWQDAQRVIEEARTPLERYTAELGKLRDMYARTEIDGRQFAFASQKLVDDYEQAANKMGAITQRIHDGMVSALSDQIFNGFKDGLAGLLKAFEDVLLRVAADMAARAVIGGAFNALGLTAAAAGAAGFGPGGLPVGAGGAGDLATTGGATFGSGFGAITAPNQSGYVDTGARAAALTRGGGTQRVVVSFDRTGVPTALSDWLHDHLRDQMAARR